MENPEGFRQEDQGQNRILHQENQNVEQIQENHIVVENPEGFRQEDQGD